MRAKSLMTALLGFAVAGGSVYAANQYLEQQARGELESQGDGLSTVVVAAMDIDFGKEIQPNMVTTQTWPANALPPGSFTNLDQVVPGADGKPRRAKRALVQGELLIRNKISEFGEKVTIVETLDPNSRAVAISVNAVSGVAGFVTPGDRVDVIMTQGGRGGLSAVTILQNIRIIAVDQVADEMKDQPGIARTVTVEVTPDQSQRLALAQNAGSLSLTLRTADTGLVDKPMDMVRLEDLLLEKSPSDEETRQPTVRVRRAGAVENVVVIE